MFRKLVFIDGETNEEGGSVQVIGGVTGSGKTEYVINEVAKSIENDKSILIFSTEYNMEHLVERIARSLAPEAHEKNKKGAEMSDELNKAISQILNADVTVKFGLRDEEDIISEIEGYENKNSLDLIVIDFLSLLPMKLNDGQTEEEKRNEILEAVEKFNPGLKCRVLITTQLNRDFHKTA